jgi:hypothetical protein
MSPAESMHRRPLHHDPMHAPDVSGQRLERPVHDGQTAPARPIDHPLLDGLGQFLGNLLPATRTLAGTQPINPKPAKSIQVPLHSSCGDSQIFSHLPSWPLTMGHQNDLDSIMQLAIGRLPQQDLEFPDLSTTQ